MKYLTLLAVLAAAVLAGTLTEPAPAEDKQPGAKATGHPEVDEDAKLTPCSQCHKLTTRAVYKEWHASTHGIGNVKCYQCHGTFETFRKVPKTATCAVCHQGHVESMTAKLTCWDCHPAHRFRGHHVKPAKKGGK